MVETLHHIAIGIDADILSRGTGNPVIYYSTCAVPRAAEVHIGLDNMLNREFLAEDLHIRDVATSFLCQDGLYPKLVTKDRLG